MYSDLRVDIGSPVEAAQDLSRSRVVYHEARSPAVSFMGLAQPSVQFSSSRYVPTTRKSMQGSDHLGPSSSPPHLTAPSRPRPSNFSPNSATFHPHSWFGKTFGLPKPDASFSIETTLLETTKLRPPGLRAAWDSLDQNFKYDWSIAREKYDLARHSRTGDSAFTYFAQSYPDDDGRRGTRLPVRSH
jgi:hypothetical protein